MKEARHDVLEKERFHSQSVSDRKRLVLFCVFGAIVMVAISIIIYIVGRTLELSTPTKDEPRGSLAGRFSEPHVVSYNQKNYRYRSDLTTILFMGVDRTAEQIPSAIDFRNGGQADFLVLLVIDSQKEVVTTIQIDRDTMAEITILGVLGNPSGTRNAQICLSHGFGNGREQSSLFTVDAVSKLLFGVDIDFYIAMNLDGIVALNDVLDGITVTLEDDFTALDPTMQKGETLTLRGKQAEYYVRHRMGIGEGTNASRMARQREYLGKAGGIIGEKIKDNANFIGRLFDALKENLITDMSRGRMINEAYASRDYLRGEMISPQGEHTIGESGFVEFYADDRALEELVLEVFFELVET